MEFHSELNPQLWNGTNLKEEVIEKLQEITEAFIEYLDIPSDAILDVRITGSSANYNYTPYSDLDLHLIVDYDKVHEDCPIVEGYLWSMKSAFNKEHDISIYGVPVEVYAEDSNNPAMSNGVYSLLNEEWIKMPEKIPPTDNDAAVDVKYNELKEAVEKMNDSEEAEELLDKIYKMRKAGLANGGEYSVENLAFKKLRNDGSIEKLKQIKKENIDKKLTLESYTETEFTRTYKFNSVEDYKNKLKDMRAKYDVQDVIEDNNLLHIVYDNNKHIGTFNNSKLEYYFDESFQAKTNNISIKQLNKLFERHFSSLKKLNEKDKSFYLNKQEGSYIRKFIQTHKNLIDTPPEPYKGARDIKAVLTYLGSTDGISAKINTPIEIVVFNERNLSHLLEDNEPQRLSELGKIKETLRNPNLILSSQETKKHNYIKAFKDVKLPKAQIVIVKVLEDGNFYVTSFNLRDRKFQDKLKEGQVIYDLSDTYATKDESLPYNNIITDFNRKVKDSRKLFTDENSIKEDNRVNNVTIQETLESSKVKQLNKLFEEFLR